MRWLLNDDTFEDLSTPLNTLYRLSFLYFSILGKFGKIRLRTVLLQEPGRTSRVYILEVCNRLPITTKLVHVYVVGDSDVITGSFDDFFWRRLTFPRFHFNILRLNPRWIILLAELCVIDWAVWLLLERLTPIWMLLGKFVFEHLVHLELPVEAIACFLWQWRTIIEVASKKCVHSEPWGINWIIDEKTGLV